MSNRRKLRGLVNGHSHNLLPDSRPGAQEVAHTDLPGPGAINAYRCEVCTKYMVIIHVDKGVTPMFLDCRVTEGCKGRSVSMMYPDQNNIPEKIRAAVRWEWYRPYKADPVLRNPEMMDHVKRGGLVLRERQEDGGLGSDS